MTQSLLTSINGTPASKFSFGTMQFGGKAGKEDSAGLFEASRAHGITFFDTAFGYTDGLSEKFLGEFATTERESLVIATKCASSGGATAANIRAQFDVSRKRLNMDVVDVLYLHRWDDKTPLEETYATLAELKETGVIRYIGVSNYSAWQIMKAAGVAEKFDLTIDIIQPMYNLVKRQVEVEILPMARSEGFRIAPYSPLGGGLLTGKYTSGRTGRLTENKMYNERYSEGWMFETAQKLEDIAQSVGVSSATLAVAWVAHNPDISHPIISARNVEQLAPSLTALDYSLSSDLYDQITKITRAPASATDR